ncbi:MAG: carboxymuconolactone decarboxylase family protein [Proteobacteria bacterium]|nr:carboxymuconolactone decarboxylase family protein [Pseudomonadota bacterium]
MDKKLAEDGLAVRRAVLGAEYVDKSVQGADDFNREFQGLLNEYCWGFVWTRPGLSRKTRSMLNLAMLSVLGRPHELKLHVRGALNNGVSRDEIKEVFMQAAIYGGVPAGVEAFRIAREVFAEAKK